MDNRAQPSEFQVLPVHGFSTYSSNCQTQDTFSLGFIHYIPVVSEKNPKWWGIWHWLVQYVSASSPRMCLLITGPQGYWLLCRFERSGKTWTFFAKWMLQYWGSAGSCTERALCSLWCSYSSKLTEVSATFIHLCLHIFSTWTSVARTDRTEWV